MVYEVTDITTPSLSSVVQQVGAYTITSTGKYKITLIGEGSKHGNYTWSGSNNSGIGSGGKLWAEAFLNANTSLAIKGIKGGAHSGDPANYYAGAGIGLWQDNTVKLFAGGGGNLRWGGGGGYNGGVATILWSGDPSPSNYNGYSWDGTKGSSTAECTSNCIDNANGGKGYYYNKSSDYGWAWGGTSYCASPFTCSYQGGGNASYYGGWLATEYGNRAPGSATITFCGLSADSVCPAD